MGAGNFPMGDMIRRNGDVIQGSSGLFFGYRARVMRATSRRYRTTDCRDGSSYCRRPGCSRDWLWGIVAPPSPGDYRQGICEDGPAQSNNWSAFTDSARSTALPENGGLP
jgi:hypothetical protein